MADVRKGKYMKISRAKVNHITNPVGYRMDKPVFSWVMEDAGKTDPFDTLYQITILSNEETVYKTDFEKLDPLGTRLDIELKPRTEYSWTISVNTEGNIETFDAGSFETGKMDEKWQAKWIKCEKDSDRHPYFEKQIDIAMPVKKARLYITGLGLYEAAINGQKVGNEYLTPGCTAYDHWVQVYTYDVTDLLQYSEAENVNNVISILVGDGWYRGRFGYDQSVVHCYGGNREILAELHIEYENGECTTVATDDTWNIRFSNIIFDGIYDGERRDDTLPELEIVRAVLSAGPASPHNESGIVETIDRMGLPVIERESFEPEMITTPAGELVADLGQNIAGLFRLRVHEKRGTRIHIQFGEILQDDNFYRDNMRTALAEYVYISDGEEHVLCPHFTYYGYRYAKISGVTSYEAGDFQGFAIYSDMDMTGSVITGHEKINKLIENTRWSMKGNFVDVPTDCPQRDERMGWTGDAQVFSQTACYLADTYAFYSKYLYDMGCEQKVRGGIVPNVVPAFSDEEYGSVWGDATCIIPWNMYLFYGDSTILKNHYNNMKSWVEHIILMDGDNHNWSKMYHNGDWLALDSLYPGNNQVMGGTNEGYIADIYYLKSLNILAQTAEILGYASDSKHYADKADEIFKYIKEEYFAPNGRCCIDTQTSYALILTENLGNKELAARRLKELLNYKSGKLVTGFVGTNILTRALSDNGLEGMAYNLLFNEEYPGWLYEVNNGATTIWERWNSVDENGYISSTGMNSLNHYSYGAIVGWIWDGSVGIRPDTQNGSVNAGFKVVTIEPKVSYKLKSVDAVYKSSAGDYEVRWYVESLNKIRFSIVIPAGCKAKIVLPSITMEELMEQCPDNMLVQAMKNGYVGAGNYDIIYETKVTLTRVYTVDDTLNDIWSDPFASKVLQRVYPKIYEYILWFRRMPLKTVLDNHNDGNEEMYNLLNKAFYEDAISR